MLVYRDAGDRMFVVFHRFNGKIVQFTCIGNDHQLVNVNSMWILNIAYDDIHSIFGWMLERHPVCQCVCMNLYIWKFVGPYMDFHCTKDLNCSFFLYSEQTQTGMKKRKLIYTLVCYKRAIEINRHVFWTQIYSLCALSLWISYCFLFYMLNRDKI